MSACEKIPARSNRFKLRDLATSLLLALLLACTSGGIGGSFVEHNAGGRSCSIDGVVTMDGAPLPGATVTIRSAGGAVSTTISDVNGRYHFALLSPDTYTLRFEMDSLQTSTRQLQLAGGDRAHITAYMKLSGVAEAITVTAAAPGVPGPGSAIGPPQPNDAPYVRRRNTPKTTPAAAAPLAMSQPATYIQPVAAPAPAEEYAFVPDNAFQRVQEKPESTFSIDVDTASYANVRRFLRAGTLPPPDAVRIEELINYFWYAYPDPSGGEPFAVSTEIADCPWAPGHRLLQIGLQARRVATASLPPANLVLLLDVSGSMADANKLPLIQQSLRFLVDQLRKEDRVAIVVYAGAAGVVLPSTTGDQKSLIVSAIDSLQAAGSTAGGEGIVLAYEIAKQNFVEHGTNRVILATDGDFNVGISSQQDLQNLIEEKRRSGIYLSVLGVGSGNYKDARMELLADKGNGNYAYLDSVDEAKKVLSEQFGGTMSVVAKDVKLQVAFNPARIAEYRLIGYENRVLAKEDFHDDTKDAGEMGAGHSVTTLYELVPPGMETLPSTVDTHGDVLASGAWDASKGDVLATVSWRYKRPGAETSVLASADVTDSNQSAFAASENVRLAAAISELGMLLRGSVTKGQSSFAEVARLARSTLPGDRDGRRTELVELVTKAEQLSGTVATASR